MIVLDASALLEVLFGTPSAGPIAERIFSPTESLHAPHLLDVEVAQVLRRYHLMGELTDERGRQALADLADLPVERYSHEPLLERIWQLRNTMTAYDAAYLTLAEALRAPLLTCDARLARAVGSHRDLAASVEVFPTSSDCA